MTNIKLIVTDLDNTLLTSRKTISDYTAGVLNRCKQHNIRFAFATARPERAVTRFFPAIEPDYIISNNGATITHSSTLLYNKTIAADTSAALLHLFHKMSEVSALTAEVGHCLYASYDSTSWEEGWNPVYHDFTTIPQGDIVKISTECSDVAIVRGILARYPELHLYENSGEAWQQIMQRDATKMNAIRVIAAEMAVSPHQIIAFGDDYNDIDMLTHCGIGIAVDNAIAAVKQAADFICGSHDEDGVACWLETQVLHRLS